MALHTLDCFQYIAGGYYTLKQKQDLLFSLLNEWSTETSIVHGIIIEDCLRIIVSYVYGYRPPSIVLPENYEIKFIEANQR
jgi:hypothetical protein